MGIPILLLTIYRYCFSIYELGLRLYEYYRINAGDYQHDQNDDYQQYQAYEGDDDNMYYPPQDPFQDFVPWSIRPGNPLGPKNGHKPIVTDVEVDTDTTTRKTDAAVEEFKDAVRHWYSDASTTVSEAMEVAEDLDMRGLSKEQHFTFDRF